MLSIAVEAGRLVATIPDAKGRPRRYGVERIDAGLYAYAARVTPLDGRGKQSYLTRMDKSGQWTCDCPDAKFRARAEQRECKHTTACREVAAIQGVEMAKAQSEATAAKAEQAEREKGAPAVYRAIVKVKAALAKEGVARSQRNQAQGYNFRGIDDVYNALSPLLADASLCVLPRVLSETTSERVSNKGGVLFGVRVEVAYDLVSAEDGSMYTVVMRAEAMDSGDKATAKAMSQAYKVAMVQTFCIPTEGDNDADAQTHEVAAPQPPRAAPAPQQPAPPKPPAATTGAVATQEQWWAKVKAFDAKLADEELCDPGELIAYLVNDTVGKVFGTDPLKWTSEAARGSAREMTAQFEKWARERRAADAA